MAGSIESASSRPWHTCHPAITDFRWDVLNKLLTYTVRIDLTNCVYLFSDEFAFLECSSWLCSSVLVFEMLCEMSFSSTVPDVNLKSKPVLRRGPAGEDANSRKSLFEVPIIDLDKVFTSS